ncbi:MAG: hypothetical protein AAGD25_24300 [Cyanobacteria bacterium P01_F01_bin.150]
MILCRDDGDQAEDYAAVSPTELSVQGGEKIAARIAYLLKRHNFTRKQSISYGVLQ